eukprot:scaffold28190_cov40-Prasinocladus_malaysianus.AAC.1
MASTWPQVQVLCLNVSQRSAEGGHKRAMTSITLSQPVTIRKVDSAFGCVQLLNARSKCEHHYQT